MPSNMYHFLIHEGPLALTNKSILFMVSLVHHCFVCEEQSVNMILDCINVSFSCMISSVMFFYSSWIELTYLSLMYLFILFYFMFF